MKKQAQFMKKGDAFVYNGSAWLCATDAYQDNNGRWIVQLADEKQKRSIIPTSSFFIFSSGTEKLEVK